MFAQYQAELVKVIAQEIGKRHTAGMATLAFEETDRGVSRTGLAGQFIACLVFALALRVVTFGDPALHVDESFYLLVGEMMHQGAVPYVDVWDRKPLGLFIIYYLIAGIYAGPIAYQVAAWLCAGATAFLISRIASRFAGRQGSILAGLLYLAALGPLMGVGGQAPVFYNLLVCGGYWIVVRHLDELRAGTVPRAIYGAMLLGGLALTVKQTTFFEVAFLGLFVVGALHSAGMPARRLTGAAAGFIALGVLPIALVAAWYWQAGYWSQFYHAMVTSNLTKTAIPSVAQATGARSMLIVLGPLLSFALLTVALHFKNERIKPYRVPLLGWLVAALLGVLAIPNFYGHYALPFAVPAAVASAAFLARKDLGLPVGGVAIVILSLLGGSLKSEQHQLSRQNMAELGNAMRNHSPNGTALILDAPPYLYSLSGLKPLSPLVFPFHLTDRRERNVSHLNTDSEFRRILEQRPGALALAKAPRHFEPDLTRWAQVRRYVAEHCRPITERIAYEFWRRDMIEVYGDCR